MIYSDKLKTYKVTATYNIKVFAFVSTEQVISTVNSRLENMLDASFKHQNLKVTLEPQDSKVTLE